MSISIESVLAGAIVEAFRTTSIKDRATFWHIFGSRTFPSLAEPMAEAVRLAAAVELVAGRMTEGVPFLDENPGLADAGLARLCALEVLQGVFQRARQLKPLTIGRDADGEHGFARLLAAIAVRDFNGANDIINILDRSALSHPMADVLCAYTFFQIGRPGEVRNRLIDGVQKLRLASFGVANSDFWRMAALVGERDCEFLALLGEMFAETGAGFDIETAASITLGLAQLSRQVGSPTPDSSRALRTSMTTLLARPDARDFLPVQKWIQGIGLVVSSLEHESREEREVDPAMVRLLGRMQVQQARLQFAAGQEARALASIQQGYRLLDEKRDTRVLQLARPIDIPSIPSVRRFEVGLLRPVSPSPISRVDADPLRPTFGITAQWVAEMDGASVLTGDRTGSVFWYVATRDGWMLADGLNVHPRLHFGSDRERMSSLSPSGRVLIDAPGEVAASGRLHGQSILLGGVPNYYHWLMEYLPKIGVLESLMPAVLETSANWLINENVAPWQVECLSLLGVQPDFLKPVRSGVTTRCDRLVVPSMMSAGDAVTFLRRRFDIERRTIDGRMIYVSRLDADTARRRVYQEELLAIALQQAGFEILVPSEMSFEDQLNAFASASVIVGPHGAGMTNLLFAQKDCVVVEIVNTHNQNYRFFSDIADAIGFKYARFLSGSERANLVEPENASSVVDAQRLLSFIDRQKAG